MNGGLSQIQIAVLRVLAAERERLRTMEIIEKVSGTEVHHRSDPAGYRCAFASMSRTLARLRDRGLVDLWLPQICRQGQGGWWTINAAGRVAVNNAPRVDVVNRSPLRTAA